MAYPKRPTRPTRPKRPTRPTRLRWPRLVSGPALAVAVAAAATGCTSSPSATTGTGAGPAVPALTAAQASQVFDAYVATTAQAARANDPALALSVTTGVQRAVLAATLRSVVSLCAATSPGQGNSASPNGGGCVYAWPNIDGFAYGAPSFSLPEAAGYPRFFLADVTRTFRGATPAGNTATRVGGANVPVDGPVLMVFEQASAPAAWRLASVSRFPSGMALPRLATDGSGYVPAVPLSEALLAQPDVTGPLQAAVVDDGPASAATRAVAAGPLTTGLYQGALDRVDGLTAPRGDVYQWDLEGAPYPAFALRTASGGALVLYSMYLNSTITAPDVISKASSIRQGPPIEVPADLLPLLPAGKPAPRDSLEDQQLFSFAAIDPPPGPAKVTVIAIGGGPDYAAAS